MDLGAELLSALPGMRRHAVSLMTDTVRVERSTGTSDPLTGDYTRDLVYAGAGKVQTYEPFEQSPDVGGATVVVQRYSVHVPVDTGPFRPGDTVTVLESRNPHLVGNEYRVAGTHEKTHQTAQRLLVDHT